MKRIVLSLLSLVLLHCEIGAAQSADFPNILDKGGIQVLCKSAVAVSAPVDTTEDTLATCTVPAGAMGANGALRITTNWSITNNANNKTPRIRYSGAAGTSYAGPTWSTQVNGQFVLSIQNRGATNSQVGQAMLMNTTAAGTSAVSTSSADTTGSTSVVMTCQKATAGDTCTLESFLVELMPSN
jgi:hypothetical protein